MKTNPEALKILVAVAKFHRSSKKNVREKLRFEKEKLKPFLDNNNEWDKEWEERNYKGALAMTQQACTLAHASYAALWAALKAAGRHNHGVHY